jgi:hypothetical protein
MAKAGAAETTLLEVDMPHMKPITKHVPASEELDALSFELVGVFYASHAIRHHGEDAAYKFVTTGHPRHYWMRGGRGACCVESLGDKSTESHPPFAFFVATKELNPSRHFASSTEIPTYRAAHPCIIFSEDWKSMDDVKNAIFELEKEFTSDSQKIVIDTPRN